MLRLVVGTMVVLLLLVVWRRVAPDTTPPVEEVSSETFGGVVDADSARRARAGILRHIAGPDSYLPAMLVESDSLLRRWPDREPLRVHLSPAEVPGYTAELREAARAAFTRWERVGAIPVHFVFVNDSASADVVVRWIERFHLRRAGQADIRWNGQGWIVSGMLTLATQTSDGLRLDRDAVYTVALHEIGHLLGLGHSDQAEDVMYPTTSVHDITARDRHTARLLYSVPPGPLRLGDLEP
jgi:hypothetical protein